MQWMVWNEWREKNSRNHGYHLKLTLVPEIAGTNESVHRRQLGNLKASRKYQESLTFDIRATEIWTGRWNAEKRETVANVFNYLYACISRNLHNCPASLHHPCMD